MEEEITETNMVNLLMDETAKREMAIIIDVVNAFIKLLEEDDYPFVNKDHPERSREENKEIFCDNVLKRAMDVIFGK